MDELNVGWGPYGEDIVPSRFYQAYRVNGPWNADDESLWYSFEPGDGVEPSEIAIVDLEDDSKTYGKIDANVYGKPGWEDVVKVTITVSEGLAESYPMAIVSIDGKEHDLAYLEEPFNLYMAHDHRISIFWAENLVETFRVVALR